MLIITDFFKNLDIDSNEGARCWNPGWGSETKDGEWAPNLKSIGVNLLGRVSCKIRSYWPNLYKMKSVQFQLQQTQQKLMDMDIMLLLVEKEPVQEITDHHFFVILMVSIRWLVSILEVMMNVALKAILLYMSA